jgi:hypothetical protein
MTMHVEGNTEQQTGNTTPPADTTQQAQQQGTPPGGEASQGTAQTEGQQQEGQQGQEQQQRDEQGRFKPGVQRRIDELTRQRHEAERRASELEQRLQQLQSGTQSSGQAPATKPDPRQFEDYGDYVAALTKYEAAQLLGQRDQQQAQALQQQRQQLTQQAEQARAEAWTERQTAARTALPDYDTVMAAAANVHVSAAVQDALLDSDRGPELAYHLAKNPAEAQRLNGLSPRQVDREIGRLEERLSRPATPPVSKAPPPLKPLGGGGSGVANATPDPSKDPQAWIAWRNKQTHR